MLICLCTIVPFVEAEMSPKWRARHSAGSLIAVNTYFEAPECVAALILVAPAIFATLTTPKVVKENQSGHDNQTEEDNSSIRKNPILGLYKMLSKTTKYIAEAISQMMKWTIDILNFWYRKLLSAILRSSLAIMLVIKLFMVMQYQYSIELSQPCWFNIYWEKKLLAQTQLRWTCEKHWAVIPCKFLFTNFYFNNS